MVRPSSSRGSSPRGGAPRTGAGRGTGGGLIPAAATARPGPGRRRRRDRHGRGRRGVLAPPELPLARTRAEQFDDLVLDAVEDLDASLADDLAALQVAVQDVPDEVGDDLAPDVVSDHGVVLARLLRDGLPDAEPADAADTAGAAPALGGRPAGPVLVVYRRPVEARAVDPEERADLVFGLVVELVAEWLGRDADEIDPR